MLQNPLELPIPEGLMERIQAYARELAWLYKNEFIDLHLNATSDNGKMIPRAEFKPGEQDMYQLFDQKWTPENTPDFHELVHWQFIDENDNISHEAFDLLDEPLTEPCVFISYRREDSTGMALALEARLKYAGHHNIFIDKAIPAGDDWATHLRSEIAACDHFVVFIHQPDIFDEPDAADQRNWMKIELDAAIANAQCTIIPVVTNPDIRSSHLPEPIRARQIVPVLGKISAVTYESALNQILNRIGYATY